MAHLRSLTVVVQIIVASLLGYLTHGATLKEKPKHIKDYSVRIIGGDVAERGQFPYQVQLQFIGTHYCGGAILNENWIVTAAHCADGGLPITYAVIANQYNIYASEGSERRRAVSRIFIHPEYDAAYFPNDIALMKLAQPLEFDELVSPINLPPANYTPSTGMNGTVSGWGSLVEAGLPPRFLHFVQVPFVSDEECDAAYQQVGETIVDSMICAGETGKDACQGDSGGPLAFNGDSQYLVGVVSWGQGCGRAGYPGVYTEVSKFIPWIEDVIANN